MGYVHHCHGKVFAKGYRVVACGDGAYEIVIGVKNLEPVAAQLLLI